MRGYTVFRDSLRTWAVMPPLCTRTSEAPFATAWDDGNSRTLSSATAGVTSAPRYMIKKLKKIGEHNLTITGYGDDDDTPRPTVFRLTVRGTGGTNNRATLLRSHYSKVF